MAPLQQQQSQPRSSTTAAVVSLNSRRERVEFAEFTFTQTPSGQCSAHVGLEWEQRIFSGRSIGQSSTFGDLRVCAEAALRALEAFAKDAMRFDLLGIKHVHAFDSDLLVVSVSVSRDGRRTRVVGCCLAETDIRRAAATAVLNATNRVLGNFIMTQ